MEQIGDPTHGYVNYVTQSQAQSESIYKISGSQVFVGVDNKTVLNPSGTGRNSVRLMSNTAYNRGIIIGDFAHIPGTECGSWPALWVDLFCIAILQHNTASLHVQTVTGLMTISYSWMVGPNWPSGGEIDIIEGVNLQSTNQMTLHTSPGCTVSVGSGGQSGHSTGDPNCGDGGGYNGCPVVSNTGTSYGTPFDNTGGGVYATQWTSTQIKIWYFARNSIPSDIKNGAPNPSNWGTPQANFGGCSFDNFMKNMNIVSQIVIKNS
jgi:hypothetical protein